MKNKLTLNKLARWLWFAMAMMIAIAILYSAYLGNLEGLFVESVVMGLLYIGGIIVSNQYRIMDKLEEIKWK